MAVRIKLVLCFLIVAAFVLTVNSRRPFRELERRLRHSFHGLRRPIRVNLLTLQFRNLIRRYDVDMQTCNSSTVEQGNGNYTLRHGQLQESDDEERVISKRHALHEGDEYEIHNRHDRLRCLRRPHSCRRRRPFLRGLHNDDIRSELNLENVSNSFQETTNRHCGGMCGRRNHRRHIRRLRRFCRRLIQYNCQIPPSLAPNCFSNVDENGGHGQ